MRLALLIPFFVLACGDDTQPPGETCGEPTYEGEASDEAWYVMLDAYDLAVTGHADAATVTVPSSGETLGGDTPATIAWSSPLAAQCPLDCFPDGFAMPLRHADTGARFFPAARAHLPPVSGDIYYVEVFVPGKTCPITAITTDQTWRPRSAEWAEMRDKGVLRLVVTSAYLEKNRIIEGPYRSTRNFEVQ